MSDQPVTMPRRAKHEEPPSQQPDVHPDREPIGTVFVAPRRDPLHDIVDDILMYVECLDEIARTVITVAEKIAEEEKYNALLNEAGAKLVAKADSIHAVLTRMEAQRAAGTKERARIDARNRTLDAAQQRLKEYVLSVMDSRGVKDLHGETVTLTSRGSAASVEIEDELAVPFEWNRLIIKISAPSWIDLMAKLTDEERQKLSSEPGLWIDAEPDKKRIGAALKADPLSVPGAKMKPGRSLQRK